MAGTGVRVGYDIFVIFLGWEGILSKPLTFLGKGGTAQGGATSRLMAKPLTFWNAGGRRWWGWLDGGLCNIQTPHFV